MEPTKALNYVKTKGWTYKESGDQVNIEVCPICANTNYKFYMAIGGDKDGVNDCKVCGWSGNLYQLSKELGDTLPGITSYKDSIQAQSGLAPIPPIEPMHKALLDDEEALDYLVHDRGFTLSVIEEYKLGLYIHSDGCRFISIPYLHRGVPVFIKYRSVPPAERRFMGIKGREAPLFNMDCIEKDMQELLFVEGEADCLSCISAGIGTPVVGVPGANVQKTTWIKRIDDAKIKKIFLLYDNDKVGQAAAKEMAHKIGIEKCYNILLPQFTFGSDNRSGKDINEWFLAGNTQSDFELLKNAARPFDVDGVVSVEDALNELEASFSGQEMLLPALDTPWPSLTSKLGGAEWGDVIGIIAEGKVGKTTLALDWLEYYSYHRGINTLMFCLEMLPKRMIRKWVSHITQTDDTPGKSQIRPETINVARKHAVESPGEILFGYLPGASKESAFDLIRQAVRRYGVKVVCFDNLQYLARSISHQTQELGNLSKGFKDLAQELNIVILLIIQPNRVRDGEIVAARNSNGSSAIEKDVDAMVAAHRNRVAKMRQEDLIGAIETEENFEPILYLRIDLSRYAPGGVCTLYMEGSTSSVRELSDIDKGVLPKVNYNSAIPVEA